MLQSNDPTQPTLQWQATQWLREWSTTQPSSVMFATLLAVLQQQSQQQQSQAVQFYALTELGRRVWTVPERAQLRQYLLFGSNNTHNGMQQQQQQISFLRNKQAWILAGLIWQDVPHHWTTLPHDLLYHLSVQQPDLFLSTIETMLEDWLVVGSTREDDDNDDDVDNDNDDDDPITLQRHVVDKESLQRVKDYLKQQQQQPQQQQLEPVSGGNGGHPTSSSMMSLLFDRVVMILDQALSSSSSNTSATTTAVILLALQTLQRFFLWTDMTVSAASNHDASINNNAPPPALQQLLRCMSPVWPAEIHIAALQAWQEWSTASVDNIEEEDDDDDDDNMDNNKNGNSTNTNNSNNKWFFFSALLEKIHQSNLLPYLGESTADIEVVIQVAKLINTAGLEVLSLLSSPSSSWNNDAIMVVWNQLLDLFFRAFAYDDIDVSTAVIPLAARLTSSMEETISTNDVDNDDTNGTRVNSSRHKAHLPQLLNTLYQQLKYPEDFSYDYEDEMDAEEIMYRTELSKLFAKLVRVAPSTCLQFICEAAQQFNGSSMSQVPTPDAEAFLRLVYHYCEGIRPAPGMKVVMKNETFCSMLMSLHRSDIASHPHREVVCLYYETAVRYYPIYQRADSASLLLPRILQFMSGAQGLQHSHVRVRSRCCYLLLRLVTSVTKLLRPYVETAVSGIHALLSSASWQLRSDDMLYLFETMGLLLGKTGLSAADQQQYLTLVMTPHVRSIEERLVQPDLKNDIPLYGAELATSLAAIAHLSKGFTKQPPDEVQVVLMETLNISLVVLEALPSSEAVRNKSMVLMQRMILCIGNKVLVKVPRYLTLLIENCTEEDILFVSQLMNQLCMKFKEEAAPVVDAALLPFLRKCSSLVPTTEDVAVTATATNGSTAKNMIPPHLRTEQLSIQKLAFVVLQHIVTHNASAVLTSSTNIGSLEIILQTMSDGAIHVKDPVIKKTCLKFFRQLLEEWVVKRNTQTELYQRGLLTFATEHLIPGMFESMFCPYFDELDAGYARVLQEFAGILYPVQTYFCNGGSESSLYEQCITRSIPNASPAVLAALGAARSLSEIQEWLQKLLEHNKRGQAR